MKQELKRKLKIHVSEETKSEQDILREKEEEYVRIRTKLDAEKKAFAARIKSFERRKEELEEELREAAKGLGVTELELVEFRPRIRRWISPKKFLEFLMKCGKREAFLDMVEVPLGRALKGFGEGVLQENDVIEIEVDDYATIQLK